MQGTTDLEELDNLLKDQEKSVQNARRLVQEYQSVCEFEKKVLLPDLRRTEKPSLGEMLPVREWGDRFRYTRGLR